MTDEFARIVAHFNTPSGPRAEWHALWTEHLRTVEPWRYRHPGGGYATFRPSAVTVALLAELEGRADGDGIAAVTFAELARSLEVDDPAGLGAHVRALRHLGAVERYARPRASNLYRLALERIPKAEAVAA